MIWYSSYRMKSAKKGIQSGQLELYVTDVFSVGLCRCNKRKRKAEKKEPNKRIKEKDKKEIYHLYLILSHPIRLPTAGFIICPSKVRFKKCQNDTS